MAREKRMHTIDFKKRSVNDRKNSNVYKGYGLPNTNSLKTEIPTDWKGLASGSYNTTIFPSGGIAVHQSFFGYRRTLDVEISSSQVLDRSRDEGHGISGYMLLLL
jgi:hypothetical protein